MISFLRFDRAWETRLYLVTSYNNKKEEDSEESKLCVNTLVDNNGRMMMITGENDIKTIEDAERSLFVDDNRNCQQFLDVQVGSVPLDEIEKAKEERSGSRPTMFDSKIQEKRSGSPHMLKPMSRSGSEESFKQIIEEAARAANKDNQDSPILKGTFGNRGVFSPGNSKHSTSRDSLRLPSNSSSTNSFLSSDDLKEGIDAGTLFVSNPEQPKQFHPLSNSDLVRETSGDMCFDEGFMLIPGSDSRLSVNTDFSLISPCSSRCSSCSSFIDSNSDSRCNSVTSFGSLSEYGGGISRSSSLSSSWSRTSTPTGRSNSRNTNSTPTGRRSTGTYVIYSSSPQNSIGARAISHSEFNTIKKNGLHEHSAAPCCPGRAMSLNRLSQTVCHRCHPDRLDDKNKNTFGHYGKEKADSGSNYKKDDPRFCHTCFEKYTKTGNHCYCKDFIGHSKCYNNITRQNHECNCGKLKSSKDVPVCTEDTFISETIRSVLEDKDNNEEKKLSSLFEYNCSNEGHPVLRKMHNRYFFQYLYDSLKEVFERRNFVDAIWEKAREDRILPSYKDGFNDYGFRLEPENFPYMIKIWNKYAWEKGKLNVAFKFVPNSSNCFWENVLKRLNVRTSMCEYRFCNAGNRCRYGVHEDSYLKLQHNAERNRRSLRKLKKNLYSYDFLANAASFCRKPLIDVHFIAMINFNLKVNHRSSSPWLLDLRHVSNIDINDPYNENVNRIEEFVNTYNELTSQLNLCVDKLKDAFETFNQNKAQAIRTRISPMLDNLITHLEKVKYIQEVDTVFCGNPIKKFPVIVNNSTAIKLNEEERENERERKRKEKEEKAETKEIKDDNLIQTGYRDAVANTNRNSEKSESEKSESEKSESEKSESENSESYDKFNGEGLDEGDIETSFWGFFK